MTILIHDTGKGWCIEDRSGVHSGFLDCLDTKKEAIKEARETWAAPEQAIRVVGPNPETIRQGQSSGSDFSFF